MVAKDLPAAGAGEDGGVGVQVRPVPGVVDHRGAGPHVDAVEGPAAGVQVGGREGEEPGDAGGVQAAPLGDGVEGQRQRGQQALALPEGQGVELAQGGGEVGLRPLGHLLERCFVLRVQGDGQGGVKEPLSAPLHLVAQGRVTSSRAISASGDMVRPALEGEGLGRLEAHLLPLQRPCRLLGGYRPQVDGQVHRRSRRHEALKEAGGQRPGPLAQVERPHEGLAYAHIAAAYLHLDGGLVVELRGRAAQGCGHQEHPKLAAPERVDGQPGPRQQAAQLVDALELADGVEAPVEDAVAGLKVGEQTPEGLRRRSGLRGKVLRLGLLQLLPHPSQARRVLPDEQLGGEVQGVERPGEGSQLRLVDLQAHHLADAELHPVQAHRTVVVQVGQHEEQGQLGRELGFGRVDLPCGRLLRSGGLPRCGLRSSLSDSFKQLLQFARFLFSRGLGLMG